MVVQLARHKRTDNKIRSLKRLMHGWRLVYTPGDRLEISNVEDPGILTAVPANRIDRVKIIPVARNQRTYFHAYLKITAFSMRFQFFRTTNVALTIGRVF